MVQIEKYCHKHQQASTIIYNLSRLYYMLRKGLSKMIMDLHLLFKRAKLMLDLDLIFKQGKLMMDHSTTAQIANMYSHFTCRSMDPNLSVYRPKEVEFSCSNTPTHTLFHAHKRKNRRHRHSYDYDADVLSKALEMLNYEELDAETSPSPMLTVREDDEEGLTVDRRADELIRRFHKQFFLEMMMTASPEHRHVVGLGP